MAEITCEQKRAAIAATHGGLGELDADQVQRLWTAMAAEDQRTALEKAAAEDSGNSAKIARRNNPPAADGSAGPSDNP